jgi:hypothetical protein
MEDEGFKDFKLGYLAALEATELHLTIKIKQIHDNIIWREIRDQILFRRFSPVSEYESDPKREEWQDFDDCYVCPYFFWRFWGLDHGREQFISQCLVRADERLPLGDPSFCRFSEYRRILFRRF